MKLWIDDTRPTPEGYVRCKSVNQAKRKIVSTEMNNKIKRSNNQPIDEIELIDIDHDAGQFSAFGGDYICLLDWLEETGRNYPIRIHSMNLVGAENMRRIIERNGWEEIK